MVAPHLFLRFSTILRCPGLIIYLFSLTIPWFLICLAVPQPEEDGRHTFYLFFKFVNFDPMCLHFMANLQHVSHVLAETTQYVVADFISTVYCVSQSGVRDLRSDVMQHHVNPCSSPFCCVNDQSSGNRCSFFFGCSAFWNCALQRSYTCVWSRQEKSSVWILIYSDWLQLDAFSTFVDC